MDKELKVLTPFSSQFSAFLLSFLGIKNMEKIFFSLLYLYFYLLLLTDGSIWNALPHSVCNGDLISSKQVIFSTYKVIWT